MRLSIETSGSRLSVALDDDTFAIGHRCEDIGRGHAERLIPLVAEMMQDTGVVRPVEIVACVGPGSFTGIRIGIAAARALALAWQVPAFGFSGLSLAAVSAGRKNDAPGKLLAVRDAFRGELFVQPFALDPLGELGDIEAVAPDEARSRARAIGAWVGDVRADDDDVWAEPCEISAAGVSLLPERFRRLPLTPLYIRAPDAKPQA